MTHGRRAGYNCAMRAVVALIPVALLACKKSPAKPPAPSATPTDAEGLWALAPDGMIAGIVVTPRGLQALEGTYAAARSLLAATPELASLGANLDRRLAVLGEHVTKLADIGIDDQHGFAYFLGRDGEKLMVVPVADRDTFVAFMGADAPCRDTGHGYACASSEALLGRLGKGTPALRASASGVHAHGEIELAATPELSHGAAAIAAVVQLDHGQIVVRAALEGVPRVLTSKLINARPRVDEGHTAAFAVANIAPLLAGEAPQPLVAGITSNDVLASVAGPLTLTVGGGASVGDGRIPLSDPAPMTTLVEHCGDLATYGVLADRQTPGSCHIKMSELASALEIWVADNELRIGNRDAKPGAEVPLTPMGRELAAGEWAFAAWGRGTLLAPWPRLLPQFPGDAQQRALTLRLLSVVNELGLGVKRDGEVVRVVVAVRTIWSNPDDVIAKVIAIPPAAMRDGTAAPLARAIAESAPSSPFAADVAAGSMSLLVPVAPLAIGPTLRAFMAKRQVSPPAPSAPATARPQLDAIVASAKRYYATHGHYPAGEAPLTPPESCCEAARRTCAGDWTQPTWKQLGIAFTEPQRFQFSYHSDGKTFTANAVGDLDCDGTSMVYVARGTVDNGVPKVMVVEPARDAD